MYLKKLEVQGFKSFADRTCLEFNSGITSVVGPNGSGKSNIADAVRWVLGEQSIKTLRGSKTEDIIFAGTEHRKPVGFAEVSLTIENSDNTLPVDYTEVTVTRRVYRSGESEYFINKTACRLKDINELFLDTGIGKDGYSIIGQGRVDEILSSKSEDRRHIFEEASGIMKYKLRKLEAEKKLELAKQNLLRINDIINELEGQIEPLRQQSETARKYLAIRENLKELEINVYIDNISSFKEKLKEFDEQYSILKQNIASENEKLERITSENAAKTERLKALEDKLNDSREQYYNIEGSLERCSSEIKVNEEKINSLELNIRRIENEAAELAQKLKELDKEEASRKEKVKYLNERNKIYTEKLEASEKEMQGILEKLDENERKVELLKAGIMDKLDLQSDKRTQINSVKSHLENLHKRQQSIDNETNQLSLDNDRASMQKEDLAESIGKAVKDIKRSKSVISGLNEKKNRMEAELAALRKNQTALKADIQFKSSRYKMLKDMERNLEGYSRSVREILNACNASPEFGRGIHGALAQLISVESRYETAIELALGGALQNIVTTSEDDAKKAIEYLKSNKLGRATFLPMTAVKGKYLDSGTVAEASKLSGFCGVASDLVSFDSQYKGIFLSLLGKVVIVENLDAGINMARKFGYSFRIVTLDGEVLSTSGSMAGGSAENRNAGILSRSREILELKEILEKLKRDDSSLEMQIEGLISGLEEIAGLTKKEEQLLRESELVRVRDESCLAQIEENIKKTLARIDMLNGEKEQLARQTADTLIELSKYEKELSEIESDINETKTIIADYQEKHREEQSNRDLLHRDITDYKISVNSILESIAGVNEVLERVAADKEAIFKSMERKEKEKEKNRREIEALRQTNEGLAQRVMDFNEEKLGRTLEIDRIGEERKVIEEEINETLDSIKAINKNILLLQEEYGRLEVRKAKIEADIEAIQNRMWDEYELTYTNALQYKKDIGSLPQAQKKIQDYKNEIRELGPVNVAAIDEYVKTKERYEFMTAQRNDMEQAKDKLHKVINEMTGIMKQQFMEQFKLINSNFNAVFRELFDGGRAELSLVDQDNVLESGIDIHVQPPGKKLQNMMLLSGGERAFTAIALLFSILRLKPTPFCILDEIEAALDDANVYRFGEYLKKYSGQTQFIMVTHRKGTMEASDSLYGVTMQEHGVSKIVSMKMGDMAS